MLGERLGEGERMIVGEDGRRVGGGDERGGGLAEDRVRRKEREAGEKRRSRIGWMVF